MDPRRNRKRSSAFSTHRPSNKQKTEVSSSKVVISTHMVPDSDPASHESSGLDTEENPRKVTDQDVIYLMIAEETHGLWVGPMDPGLFLERFLPQGKGILVRPDFGAQTFAAIPSGSDESKMYGPFIEAISPFAPQMKLVDTHSMPDPIWGRIAVGVSVYPAVSVGPEVNIMKTDFSRMEFCLDFKHKDSDDPFADFDENPKATDRTRFPFERGGFEYSVIRGQIGSHTSALAGAQFRLHSFSVLICGKWARLLRWDRNGVIVTRKFSYADEDHLVEFFWRYSHTPSNALSRGHDPSVELFPHTEDAQTLEETAARAELVDANSEGHREFRTMTIPDRDTDQEFQFLISYPPKSIRHSPFGRATRPMLAFDLDKNMMVFVKDYWRPVGGNIEKEGDIYKLLHGAGVPYIPPFGKGNDIRNHVTLTDIVRSEDWAYPTAKMVSLCHYRISLEEIGRPLNEFKSSHELITAVADAMEAHEFAYYDAKILHRDISTGNIIITRAGRGMLIDWDLCFNMNNLQDRTGQPKRTGTWEFLSVFLLTNREHLQGVIDDKESSLYVVLWNMLRYTQHNKMTKLSGELKLFDEVSEDGEDGGIRKRDFLFMKNTEFTFTGRPHLDDLIQELSYTFLARYEKPIPGAVAFYATPEGAKAPFNPLIRKAKLEDRKWLVQTFRTYLSLEGWPKDDAARRNPIVTNKIVM